MASYNFTTTAPQEAAITDARNRYNNSLPSGAGDPGAFATNGAFLANVVTSAIQNWNGRPTGLSLDLAAKNSAIALLQADVARGDANSPTAQALLTALQNAV